MLTRPVLIRAPPIISVIQCTPEKNLPITIKATKNKITVIVKILNLMFEMRFPS